jgi:predicted AAA+ superfamily ATPase
MQVQNSHIEYLIQQSEWALSSLPVFPFKRYLYHHIDWSKRLIGIKGLQNTGKTSTLLHVLRMKLHQNEVEKGIYISLDDLFFSDMKVKVALSGLYMQGYRHFAFDQVHTYPNWEHEFESILSFFPDCTIVYSGSNIIESENSTHHLYPLWGLSFREYVQTIVGQSIPFFSLEQLIEQQHAVRNLTEIIKRPQELLASYFKESYFPGINLEIEEGSFFGLLGPNGAGKSTLINIISSIVKKTSG